MIESWRWTKTTRTTQQKMPYRYGKRVGAYGSTLWIKVYNKIKKRKDERCSMMEVNVFCCLYVFVCVNIKVHPAVAGPVSNKKKFINDIQFGYLMLNGVAQCSPIDWMTINVNHHNGHEVWRLDVWKKSEGEDKRWNIENKIKRVRASFTHSLIDSPHLWVKLKKACSSQMWLIN